MNRYYPESFIGHEERYGSSNTADQWKMDTVLNKSTEGGKSADRKKTQRKSQDQANTCNQTLNKTTKPKSVIE